MFFLMSSERSGSNFITKLMNGHSNICGPSTKHIINVVSRNLFRYKDLNDEHNWNELLKDIYLLLNVEFSIWRKKFSYNDLKDLAPKGDIKSLIRNIFYEEARANGKKHVFIKENHVYEFLPFLLIHYPEAKYVYLVRDPRDMALSWKKNSNHLGGVVKGAKQWKKDQQNTLKYYSELNKLGKAYLIKYEDLITESVKYSKEIIEFLGLKYDKNILDFYKDELTKENSQMLKAWNNLSKAVLINNKKKYLNELDSIEIKSIEKICFYEMSHLGYETEFSKQILDGFDDNEIEKLDKYEIKTIEYKRDKGVQDNMNAKKQFYQKLID